MGPAWLHWLVHASGSSLIRGERSFDLHWPAGGWQSHSDSSCSTAAPARSLVVFGFSGPAATAVAAVPGHCLRKNRMLTNVRPT